MDVSLLNFIDAQRDVQLESRNWRNAPHVACYFRIPHIDPETHESWLESLHGDHPPLVAFFIVCDGKYVGVTYFSSISYTEQQCDWGIYIHELEYRGLGVGSRVLRLCIEYATRVLNMERVYLDVLGSNARAIKLYENCGFSIESDRGGVLRMFARLQ